MNDEDYRVLLDAAKLLEQAARLLRKAHLNKRPLEKKANSEVRAAVNAAIARLPDVEGS
jgi:hypothetical protein